MTPSEPRELMQPLEPTEFGTRHQPWRRPPRRAGVATIYEYALTLDGYQFAKERFGRDCAELGNERREEYERTGGWRGNFEELRCCLFFEQRRAHWNEPQPDDIKALRVLYRTLVKRWYLETEPQ